MPSERHRSKEDTWSTNELKRALNKDEIRKEREKLRRERKEGRGDEEIEGSRRRREEDGHKERRQNREDDDRRRHKDDDRRSHHRDKDEDRRRRRDEDSNRLDEDERERQRRERREKREGKLSKDTKEREHSKRRPDTEDDDRRERRHRDKDEEKRHRDRDEDRRHRDDEDREKRREEERERRRREREGEKDKRSKDRDRDRDERKHTNGADDEGRRRHKDEDRDRRKDRKDRHRDDDDNRERRDRKERHKYDDEVEDERERQRRERREKREGKDKDRDRDREKEREKRKREEEEERQRRKERERREKEEREKQERMKSSYGGNEDEDGDDYEDDFEDYDDDFEDDDDEEEAPAPTRKPETSSYRNKYGRGDDEMAEVLRALDQENDRLVSESRQERYTPEANGFNEERYGSRYDDDDDESPEPASRSATTGLINFSTAKQKVMNRRANSKTAKRAADLLQMLELDVARYDIFDLPPVKEYDLYIRSFGRTDTQQAYVQTNDDNIDRDIQTEEIDYRQKWTQHPAEDFIGCGRGDGEKDLDEEEQSQQNKQQDLGRLNKFVQKAGQVIAILLDEEKDRQRKEDVSANRSNMAVSEGYTELSILSMLKDRHVVFADFSPSQPNYLLTIYSKPSQIDDSNPACTKGIICVWNTNEPSYPQRILACESQPVCCCFSPYKTTLVFAGMVDGSICAWDLREPPSLHQSIQYKKTDHVLRFPTYNTAGVLDVENHHSPVTTLNPVVSYSDNRDSSELEMQDDLSSGLSFQLVSCEEQGMVNFWVVAEISNPDMAGSETDLGLSPGGRVKLVRSSSILLQSPSSKGTGPVRAFGLQLSPGDPNHYYVGTEGGYILHGLRFGTRAYPRIFSTITDAPADVTCLDFSPFSHPCFLASTADGCVHLFHCKTDTPLVTWPSKVWGSRHVRCVCWSRSRPCVFYVLDNDSRLYTFDFLEGDVLPAKIETLSDKDRAISISFTTDHRSECQGHQGRLPQMMISFENGDVQIHTISKEYREQQTLEHEFLPSYLARF